MEQRWKFSGEQKIRNAWTVVANENAYHPVRDYLNGLVWDGTERLDTMLIRYMAAEDTPYVRAVTRKWMVGAVKRVMQPGCKFDQMLILVGAQGIGKSRLAIVLSRGWFTDSITRMDGKEAYESIRGAWIVEVAELAATRKSEQEAQKQFISAQTDMYRPAYGRNVVVYPRQCVFYGTTNDLEPLKDDTGARRYWPVLCAGKDDGQHFGLEEEVDQLWAEAVVRYKAGESLWLDDKALASDAKEAQEAFSTRDEWIGLIQDFLDIPLPPDWYERTPEQRRAYIAGDTLEDQEKNTMRRGTICVTEVRMELFGESKGGRSGPDATAKRIGRIIASLPGWERAKTARRVPGYGAQKVFVRK
jgi:predicted P-loop ATPase